MHYFKLKNVTLKNNLYFLNNNLMSNSKGVEYARFKKIICIFILLSYIFLITNIFIFRTIIF